MGHSIAADNISTPEVTPGECELNLGPATDIERSIADLEGVVPDYAAVRLLTFVGMLTDSTFVTLRNKENRIETGFKIVIRKTYRVHLPVLASRHVELAADTVLFVKSARLNVTSDH